MKCPFCQAEKDSLKVIDSRSCDAGRSIRRRRECLKCDKRFTTYERIEAPARVTVIKKDGRRQPWDRAKIVSGLERACFKRPVAELDLHRLADDVEEEALRTHDREVPTEFVAQLVAEKLRRLDQVAYVRFASVSKKFKTLEELVSEARAVLDARRYEDPSQGKLFVDMAGIMDVPTEGPSTSGLKNVVREPQAKAADGGRHQGGSDGRAGKGRNGRTRGASGAAAAGVRSPGAVSAPEAHQ
jgi:transcriptional repressor NrdR